jgi:hypothetical protein
LSLLAGVVEVQTVLEVVARVVFYRLQVTL